MGANASENKDEDEDEDENAVEAGRVQDFLDRASQCLKQHEAHRVSNVTDILALRIPLGND